MDFSIRKIRGDDAAAIVGIDAVHSGEAKAPYWKDRLRGFMRGGRSKEHKLGYVAVCGEKVVGYVLAEARAWEFGSPNCGWIFAIGVDPENGRSGVGQALCREVCLQYRHLGIRTVRTMVRKDDIDVLSFFRAFGFHAGPFVELELDI